MNLSRQSDSLPEAVRKVKVTVIGAGGIGSWTVLGLAKLGFQDIEVFDDDSVEDVNIPSQCYSPKQIGKPKVEALNDVVKLMTETELTTFVKRFDECKTSVLIVAVDNMETRKSVAEGLRDGKVFADFVIDARMAIESGIVQPYSFSTVEKYLKTLYTDQEAVQEACTNRAISYTTMVISGLICRTVIAFLRDEQSMSINFNLKTSETEKPDVSIFSKSVAMPEPLDQIDVVYNRQTLRGGNGAVVDVGHLVDRMIARTPNRIDDALLGMLQQRQPISIPDQQIGDGIFITPSDIHMPPFAAQTMADLQRRGVSGQDAENRLQMRRMRDQREQRHREEYQRRIEGRFQSTEDQVVAVDEDPGF